MKILLVFVVAAAISARYVRGQCDCGCGGRMPIPTPSPCQQPPVYNSHSYPAVQPQAPLTNMLPPGVMAQLYQSQPLYMSMAAAKPACAPAPAPAPCASAAKPQQAMPQIQMPQMNHYTGFHAPAMPSHPPICVQSVYVGKREDEQEKDTSDKTCSCSTVKRKSNSKRKPSTEEDTQEVDTDQPEDQNQQVYNSRPNSVRRSSPSSSSRRVRKQRRQVLSPALLRSLLAAQSANTCNCADDTTYSTGADSGDNFDCGCGCDNAPSIVYIRK